MTGMFPGFEQLARCKPAATWAIIPAITENEGVDSASADGDALFVALGTLSRSAPLASAARPPVSPAQS